MAATKLLRPTYAFQKRLEFLSSGKVYLKEVVKIITFSYRTTEFSSRGLRQFISKKLPPVQFKNPDVQMMLFKNTYHFKYPVVNIYFSDGKKVILDVEGKKPEKILSEIVAIAGKTEEQVLKARREAEYNPANFGDARKGRLCICEVPGQVPCTSKVARQNVEHSWHQRAET